MARPTVLTKTTVLKLEQALRDGFTIEMACHVSGISRSTYYTHLQADNEFSDKMVLAQDWATQRARQVVVKAINAGDLVTAKWWLERKSRAEFSNNLPQGLDRSTNAMSITDRYFRGDENKMAKWYAETVIALAEPLETKTE